MQLINTCTYVVEAILSLWMDFPPFNRPTSIETACTIQHPHMRAFRTPVGETKEGRVYKGVYYFVQGQAVPQQQEVEALQMQWKAESLHKHLLFCSICS